MLDKLQRLVDEWIRTYGVHHLNLLTNVAILMGGTGEVARVMARLYNEQGAKTSDRLDLTDELTGLLWIFICIANQYGINL